MVILSFLSLSGATRANMGRAERREEDPENWSDKERANNIADHYIYASIGHEAHNHLQNV